MLVHAMRGTDRSRVKKRGELVLGSGKPEAPDWLLPEGKAEWDRLLSVGPYAAVIEKPDRALLAVYCQLWARFVEGEQTKEYLSGRELQSLVSLGAKFGLSPTDRTKMPVSQPKAVNDPWAKL